MFKTRLDTFEDDFGHFLNFETFLIFFLKIFVWKLLGTILGIFGTLKLFWFFWKFSKTRPSMEHWAKNFFERITLKHLQNTFGHFWDRIWAFLEFWKFFDSFENFRRLDPPSNTGQKFFSKRLTLNLFKTRLDTFGNDFGLFWNFEIFFVFENFRLDTFGDDFGHFGFLKLFWFFWKNSKTRPSMEHWAKIFFEKNTLKHLQNTFGHFWDRICAFLEFWKFFDFFEKIRRLDPPWNTGQKIFSRKSPQNMFKTRLDSLGTIWAFLDFWKFFWLWKFSSGLFWGRFWAFLEFWNFFDFFGNFRRLDPPWNTGQKTFSKKITQNMFKTRLDTFEDDFGHFLNFETFFDFFWKFSFGHFWGRFWAFLELWNFFDFLENFRRRDPPWNTGRKIFSKESP